MDRLEEYFQYKLTIPTSYGILIRFAKKGFDVSRHLDRVLICNCRDIDRVRELLEMGANPRYDNSRALKCVVSAKGGKCKYRFEIIKLLVEYGADPRVVKLKISTNICDEAYEFLYALGGFSIVSPCHPWHGKIIADSGISKRWIARGGNISNEVFTRFLNHSTNNMWGVNIMKPILKAFPEYTSFLEPTLPLPVIEAFIELGDQSIIAAKLAEWSGEDLVIAQFFQDRPRKSAKAIQAADST